MQQPENEQVVDVSGGRKVAIKFLISNSHAGSLIGKSGKAIKELIAVSEARVNVSGNQELYPGTSERVALVAGTQDSVSLAQTLIWEMIAQNGKATAEDRKTLEWSPEAVVNSLGTNDNIQVSAKITIPAAAGGLILGKGGETIRSIAAESGSKVDMPSNDDAMFNTTLHTIHTIHYTHSPPSTHYTHYTLYTTHYTLHTTHYTLHTTHYTLHTTHTIHTLPPIHTLTPLHHTKHYPRSS